MVPKHKLIKIRDLNLLEVDSGNDNISKDSAEIKEIEKALSLKNYNLCIKNSYYKKIYWNNEKKYVPQFFNYYLTGFKGKEIENISFKTHSVTITSDGIENFYNIKSPEENLSFKEIKDLNIILSEIRDEDGYFDSNSYDIYFKNLKISKKLLDIVKRYSVGFGLLELFFYDKKVQDVFVDSPGVSEIHIVHEDFGECSSNVFVCEEELEKISSKIRLSSGRPFDSANPSINASIERLNVRVSGITEPLAFSGTAFAFRKRNFRPFTIPMLVRKGFFSSDTGALLSFLADGNASILVTGPRGSGKTSLLSALMLEIPRSNRFVVIEDTPELPIHEMKEQGFKIQHLRVKQPLSGDYEVSASDALRAALRLGESVLVIGEVRGNEAKALFEAMRIGAAGNAVLGTIHGSSASETFERVVNDLSVEKNSFKSVDVIACAGFERIKDSIQRKRKLLGVSEVKKESEASRDMFLEISDGKSISIEYSGLFSKISKIKLMKCNEALKNINLRKMIIEEASKSDKLCELDNYIKLKDFYYSSINNSVYNNKKIDYDDLYNNINYYMQKWK